MFGAHLSSTLCRPLLVVLHFFFVFFALQKGGHSASQERLWTQQLGYQTAANDSARGRIQDPYTFAPHHGPLTVSLIHGIQIKAGHGS